MSRLGRIRATAVADGRSFLRRRTAIFFTFLFPILLILIFGAVIRTDPTGGGLFAEPPAYYVPGYLAVVVLFTPLSRVSSEVARTRAGNRFEKLATTPLSRTEWLLAQTLVNVVVIGVAAILILGLVIGLTGAAVQLSPWLVVFVLGGVVCFCGVGSMIGSYTGSRDGAISASNTIALPVLFLSETFVTTDQLPGWFGPIIDLSPLTYFARGVRAATIPGTGDTILGLDPILGNLVILFAVGGVAFALGARSIPRTD